jgi:acid phosphatase type 7
LQVATAPAAPGVFSLDRLRLGNATGPENYLYTAGDVIHPEGGVDSGSFYRFVVTAPGGAITNSPSCRPASDFPSADNTYTLGVSDPTSTATSWRYTLEQYSTSACTGSPTKTTFKSFFVAKATVTADAALTTPKGAFRTGETAFVVVKGVMPGTNRWNVTWLLPSGAVACANTAGNDRPASHQNGTLPKGGDGAFRYRPDTTATGSSWNREANYETRPCPAFASANQGRWRVRLQVDATHFVVVPVFDVDTTPPPAPSIDAGPANPTTTTTATFEFSVPESAVSFLCALDGAAFSVCASPRAYSGLIQGAHRFDVKARDSAGNESSLASYSWVVRVAPTVTLTSPPNGSSTNDSTPTFSGQASTETGDSTTVTVTLYAGASSSGTPIQTLIAPVTNGSYSIGASPLGDGTYTGLAEQSDVAGNVGRSQTSTFTVDVTPPVVTLDQPADGSTVSTSTPTFSGAAGTATGDEVAVIVRVYTGTTASGTPVQQLEATRSGGTWSVTSSAPLDDGTYTALAEQADAAGNVGHSAARTFSVVAPPPPPPADYRAAVLNDAPRAYWRLGEATGTAAADETSNRITGTYLNGVMLGQTGAVSSDANASIALDGVDDTVRVPNATALNSSTAMSVELWVNFAALPASSATLARKEGQYLLRLMSGGSIVFRLWKSGSITEVATASGAVSANAWHHVVATWDGATMRLYVNGTARASRSLAAPADINTNDLYLGSSYNSYDRYGGRLDEPAVYATALPESRIQAHYTTANPAAGGGPSVSLPAPANGSTTDATPNFGGIGGTAVGDASTVTVKVYSGSTASGTLLQAPTAPVRTAGTFSVSAAALASGTYTAVAEQVDSAGRIGRSPQSTFTVDAEADPVLLAAGDIAGCDTFGDEATVAVLDRLPGTVVPVGDLAYEDGTAQQFADCYDATWGRHKARTRPVVGGHEYRTPGAAPYYAYFGAAAGDPSKGYYSYDVGAWHVIALNDVCTAVGGCGAGSPEEQWLRADLAASAAQCTVAFLHTPRFSSGSVHGSSTAMQPFWQALYESGAELVVSAHEHIYERFAPQTPTGSADPVRGIRQIIAGTGGRSHYAIGTIKANSEVRNVDSFGILKLTLRASGYDWQFVPEAGRTFTDSGSGTCH